MDTHTDVSIDEREYSDFLSSDFLPFIAGIKEEVPTILVNHNIVKCMDPDLPASLSDNIHRILREDLKFSGLIITDDLSMDAVKSYVENGQAVVQAVLAGNDMIITSDLKKHKDEILQAVREGKISEDIINRAVLRVIACKFAYGLL
ncbi:MAG: glycoside hydrolase family 3 protein [Clostridia bacterium]|nr:glycoside hydrolase family 3 protein [Clostridia bacterium]